MPKKSEEKPSYLRAILNVIGIISGIISILFFLFIVFIIVAAFSEPTTFSEGNIAVIPIEGVITTQGSLGAFTNDGLQSADIVQWIAEAEADETIKAVIFRIDSPGGSPVATDEIASAIRAMDKPSVSVIREVGASGAYWVASATDKIYANRMSMVGSIGVLASYIEFAGTLERYNATYRSLTAGEFKDTGDPFKRLTPKEEALFQQQLDKLHSIFIKAVAENRGLPEDKVRQLATGWVYLGTEALDFGLIDALGNEDDAIADLEEELGITAEVVEFASPLTFFESFSSFTAMNAFALGRGFAYELVQPRMTNNLQVWT
ncbi:signal peptide peptidase SppA [Candidatus Woesearchaeota archaeon]|nr:signal peptide peptidase SppA [Candidatus Woesearchaeota archaeon]